MCIKERRNTNKDFGLQSMWVLVIYWQSVISLEDWRTEGKGQGSTEKEKYSDTGCHMENLNCCSANGIGITQQTYFYTTKISRTLLVSKHQNQHLNCNTPTNTGILN